MRRLGAALAAMALVTAGCASSSEDGGGEGGVDPVIWYDWDPNGPAMLALISGTLVLDDGCLTIDGQPIALPRDLGTWDASTVQLVYGDVTYAPGDAVSAGGGGGSITEEMTVPEGCGLAPGDGVFFVQDRSLG
ncbi:hypothetical protein [Demequina sp. NBRC 110056]|uniref:hypothetical protein n=1 Tax=Demequina sp. NBRC 110056 TaxID=1570345 RepID=UPI0009FF1FB5|nr:hypothetical protein [Demequina sp. NBRC 110056]